MAKLQTAALLANNGRHQLFAGMNVSFLRRPQDIFHAEVPPRDAGGLATEARTEVVRSSV